LFFRSSYYIKRYILWKHNRKCIGIKYRDFINIGTLYTYCINNIYPASSSHKKWKSTTGEETYITAGITKWWAVDELYRARRWEISQIIFFYFGDFCNIIYLYALPGISGSRVKHRLVDVIIKQAWTRGSFQKNLKNLSSWLCVQL